MHAGLVSAIEAKTKVDVDAAVRDKVSYATFKCRVAEAVRAHDMKCVMRKHRWPRARSDAQKVLHLRHGCNTPAKVLESL
jgi:hypothetical protein